MDVAVSATAATALSFTYDGVTMKSARDGWTAEAGTLTSGSAEVSTLSLSYKGPAILRFATEDVSGVLSLTIGKKGIAKTVPLNGESYGFYIPPGNQAITLNTSEQGAALSGFQFVPAPESAGTFTGYVFGEPTSEMFPVAGSAQMTVSPSSGKGSGKIVIGNKTYTFAAFTFDYDNACNRFTNTVSATHRSGKTVETMTWNLAIDNDTPGFVTLALAETNVTRYGDYAWRGMMNRNGFADKTMATMRRNLLNARKTNAYYTMLVLTDQAGNETGEAEEEDTGEETEGILPTEPPVFGTGYLTATIGIRGTVRVTGRLADGTVVSYSTIVGFIPGDEGNPPMPYFLVCPMLKTYRGGFFFSVITGVGDDRVSGEYLWINENPKATGEGDGFAYDGTVIGGPYDKKARLQNLYGANGFYVPTPNNARMPLAFNAQGSGVTVPDVKDGSNPDSLTFRLTKATGVFSGSFNEQEDGKASPAKRNFYGVLTPSLLDEGYPGAGYTLLPKTAPKTPTMPSYRYTRSQDLFLWIYTGNVWIGAVSVTIGGYSDDWWDRIPVVGNPCGECLMESEDCMCEL